MAQAQMTYGRRLVDVLDLHWYPEAQGGGIRITGDDTSPAVVAARLQAPRSLWDPTYNESSWIQSSIGGPIQLIPMLKAKIAAHYPGTKLAFTEYNYGAGGDISGGIAQADVLGIFGQQGVFAANMWGLSTVTYIGGAFQMYQDPAGNGTKVGDMSVSTSNSDIVDASAYGFANSANANEVDAVVLNKTASPMTTTIQITNPVSVNSVKIYQLTSASAVPQPAGTFAVQNNQYQYTRIEPAGVASHPNHQHFRFRDAGWPVLTVILQLHAQHRKRQREILNHHAELADRFVNVRNRDDIGEDHHVHGKRESAQPSAEHLRKQYRLQQHD
jgi:hypothetical protein